MISRTIISVAALILAAGPAAALECRFKGTPEADFVSANTSSADFKLRHSGEEIAFRGSLGTDIRGRVYGTTLDDGTQLTYFVEPKGVTVAVDRAGAKIRRITGRCHK